MKEKRVKFKNLAENRVNKALKDLQLIGNLSNTSNYAYSEEDVRKILKALRDGVDDVRSRFEASSHEGTHRFTLD